LAAVDDHQIYTAEIRRVILDHAQAPDNSRNWTEADRRTTNWYLRNER
jgi:hypothetical protein